MRSAITLCLFFGFATVASAEIRWMNDLEQGYQRAATEGKPLLIHFWSYECPPCRALEQNVFAQPEVQDAVNRHFVAVKVNVDHAKKMAEETGNDLVRDYRIKAWPTDVVVGPDGKVFAHEVSPQVPANYMKLLDFGLASFDPSKRGMLVSSPQPRQDTLAARPNMPPQGAPPQGMRPPANQFGQPQNNPADPSRRPDNFAGPMPSPTAPAYAQQSQFAADSRGGDFNPGGRPANPVNPAAQQPQPSQQPWQQATTEPSQPARPTYGAWAANEPVNSAVSEPKPNNDFGFRRPEPTAPTAPSSPAPSSPAGYGANTGGDYNVQAGRPGQANPQYVANNPSPTRPEPAPQPQPSMPPVDPGVPAFAMNGDCVVTILEENKVVQGNKKFGAIHRGKTYLFASQEKQQKFLADPDRYSPVLGGLDPVVKIEQNRSVDGKREFGLFFEVENGERMFLFSSQESMEKFKAQRQRYAAIALEMMDNPSHR